MSKSKTAKHIKTYSVEQWKDMNDKTRKDRLRKLNTVRMSEEHMEGVQEYYVSKSGDTDVLKRGTLLGKKPSQKKGSKRERTGKPKGILSDKVMNLESDSD